MKYLISFEKDFDVKSQQSLDSLLEKLELDGVAKYHQFARSASYSLEVKDEKYLAEIRAIPGIVLQNADITYRTQAGKPSSPK